MAPRLHKSVLGPEVIQNENELTEALTRPSPELVEFVKTLSGRLLILGAGGKMGPTLTVLAQRAVEASGHPLEVVAVSRFGDAASRDLIRSHGIETIPCDLLDQGSRQGLPSAENVLFLVGLKFGTGTNPSATWAVNTLIPAWVTERYPRARIVALSTGNVYPLSQVKEGGAVETEPLTPLGEYANAAVARERIFEFGSLRHSVAIALIRLFYAVELRYGVLLDIGQKIYLGKAIDLTTGYFNCVWQGDANQIILRALSLAASPPSAWNLCRPEVFSVRTVAVRLGELLGLSPRFTGKESSTALLGNPSRLCAMLGEPATPMEMMLRWTAAWIQEGGRTLGKATHFETRDGKY